LWLVLRKEDNKVIGRAGIENREIDGELQKELGYLIGKPWQGMGYAAEACFAILDYVKERELCSYLFLCCHQKNIPSISLAQKMGFTVYAEDIDGMNLYIYKSNA
jgi:[ribosomal protein S5]-alanine N-acetyltransferase